MAKKLVALVLLALAIQLTVSMATHANALEPIGLNALLAFDRLPYLKADTLAGGQSSYDRTGGNNDYDYYSYRDTNGDKVLLDLQGPGVVYRMWFTGFIPTEGNIKIYFDGETTPRVNMLIADLTSGNHPPFVAPLVGNDLVSSGGYYAYVPLSFSKSIKIVTNQNAIWFYYNLGYHLLNSDTPIATWSPAQDTSAAKILWSRAGVDPKNDNGNAVASGTLNLAAGATQTIFDSAGPRSIASIKLRIPGITASTPASDATDILNNTWIRISWDDETTPSVSAPIGSFFAMGQFGAYATRSLMVGKDDTNAMYVYFPMPFQKRARIQLTSQRTNDTNNISYEIKHAPFTDSFANVGYFKTSFVTQTSRADDEKDIIMLDAQGAGQLVGVVGSFVGPANRLFMEGDERIYIDDSESPAIQGTGTEDFFNGGWYFKNGLFTLPTHGHTARGTIGGRDYISAYRLFLSDAIPFRKHLVLSMEHGSRNSITMDSWTLAYYYHQPSPRAVLTDALDVGQSASETAHAYTIDQATWSGAQGFTYDGIMDAYGSRDDGRAQRGSSQFRLAINPSNEGVLLRRRLDYGIANQQGNVFVDGQPVGTWYTAGSNPYHRWRDDDFVIPALFTRGKNVITVQIIDASPTIDWTEFLYLAFSITSATPTTPIPTTVPTSTSVAPPTATRMATLIPSPTQVPIPTFTPIICAPPSVIATIPVDASPKAIAFDPGTNRAFVALFDDSSVAVIDTKTNQHLATWNTRSRGHANGIAFANNRLFVSLRDSASVAVLDATTGALVGNVSVGGMPYGIGVANNRTWVANFAARSVSVLDATTRTVLATTTIGDFPAFVIADNNRAFVSYYGGGVAVIGSDGAFQNRFAPLGGGTFGMAFNATTNNLYVANRDQRQLWVINPATGQIVKGIALSKAPSAMTINPITNRLYVVLADTNQVDVRDGATLERIALVSVGEQGDQGGDGIAISNGRVYVSNNADGTVSVIQDSCP